MSFRAIHRWIETHPARAGTLAGWYQQAAGAVAALVVVPFVLRGLPGDEAGLWFSFQGLLLFVNLADFGLSFVIARQVAYSLHARSDQLTKRTDFIALSPGWAGVSDVYAASRQLFRWVAVVGFLLLAGIYHLLVPLGRLLPTTNGETTAAWYLLGVSTIMGFMTKPHFALLEGLARVYATRLISGTTQLLSAVGVVLVLESGGGLATMAAVVAAVSMAQWGAARLSVRAVAGDNLLPVTELPRGLIRKCLRVGAPMGVLSLGAFLVSYVQVPLIGFLMGPQGVPGFYLAQRIGQTLNLCVMHLMHPQLPLFTQELALEDFSRAAGRMKRCILWVSGLAALTNTVFFFLSPTFADFWVGPSKYVSPSVLLLLSVDYFILAAAVVWGHFVLASGRNPFMYSTLISGFVNLGLCVALVSKFGMVGIPLASLLAGLGINYWFNPWMGWKLYQRLRSASQSRSGTF